MDTSCPENLPADRKKAIAKLTRGRELANRLRLLLADPLGDHPSSAVNDLAMEIMGSFTETLSILSSPTSDEVSQIPANTRVGSPSWDGRKSEDSGESTKTSAFKDRRGCYKRRKTSQTWTRVTPNLIDDGHAWRKYGQKQILGAKYPRNYYRCTHKFDQGCQATKQVQRTEDEPEMYRTTYSGGHTCRNLLKPPQIIIDSTTVKESAVLLSFGSDNPKYPSPTDHPFFPSFPLIKQEYKEEMRPSKVTRNNQASSSDYLIMSPDLTTFNSSGPMTGLSSESDYGDVISSGVYHGTGANIDHASLGMEMDMDMMVSVDLEDVLKEF